MSEKPEEDFEDDAAEEIEDGESGLDVDKLMRDFDTRKRRGARSSTEPAWRRLERVLEDRRTAGLLSDFDDYEIGGGGEAPHRSARPPRR